MDSIQIALWSIGGKKTWVVSLLWLFVRSMGLMKLYDWCWHSKFRRILNRFSWVLPKSHILIQVWVRLVRMNMIGLCNQQGENSLMGWRLQRNMIVITWERSRNLQRQPTKHLKLIQWELLMLWYLRKISIRCSDLAVKVQFQIFKVVLRTKQQLL